MITIKIHRDVQNTSSLTRTVCTMIIGDEIHHPRFRAEKIGANKYQLKPAEQRSKIIDAETLIDYIKKLM